MMSEEFKLFIALAFLVFISMTISSLIKREQNANILESVLTRQEHVCWQSNFELRDCDD